MIDVVFPDRKSEIRYLLREAFSAAASSREALKRSRLFFLVALVTTMLVLASMVVYPGTFWGWTPLHVVLATCCGWRLGDWWLARRAHRVVFERLVSLIAVYSSTAWDESLVQWRDRALKVSEENP